MTSAPNPRIVSLWDMKQLLALDLVNAAEQLERVEVLIAERKARENFDPDEALTVSTKNNIAARYKKFAESAEAMNAPISARLATVAVRKLRGRKDPFSVSDLGVLSAEIHTIMYFELDGVKLYCLPSGASALYSPSEPLFGTEVEARINKAADDISECGKCLAVGRYTAAVFHLMRAMEAAVQKISGRLNIRKIERAWGPLLSDIHKKIEAMPKGDERDEWSQVHANLYHVKQAWRNDTMHPKATYT